MGIYIRPHESDSEVWADADLSGNYFPEEAKDDSDTARSCSGFVVYYFGDFQLCGSSYFIQIYPPALLILISLYSVKNCTIPFL